MRAAIVLLLAVCQRVRGDEVAQVTVARESTVITGGSVRDALPSTAGAFARTSRADGEKGTVDDREGIL